MSEEDELVDRGDLLEDEVEELEEAETEEDTTEEVVEEVEDVLSETDKRFNTLMSQIEEQKDRNSWLEEQLSKLIDQSKAPIKPEVPKEVKPPYDFEGKEEEYITLIIEGETAKAAKLRLEINKNKESQLMDTIKSLEDNFLKASKKDSSEAIENNRFQDAISTFETKYPFLNSEDKAYNEEAVDTVNSLIATFQEKGMKKTEALTKAVNRVVKLYEKPTKSEPTALGASRTKEAGKVAASASSRQPASTTSVKGTTSTTAPLKAISKMSDKEFRSLSAAELRSLRGD